MTKYIICSILTLTVLILCFPAGAVNSNKATLATVSDQQKESAWSPSKAAAGLPEKNYPVSEDSHTPEKGMAHRPSMDETPHIHHFHKHRVKKMKKHHEKFWFLSQLLIIACNLVLIFMAYQHITH